MAGNRPGPKSLEEKTGEESKMVKVLVTASQYEYLMSRDIPASAYLRKLLATDMVISRADGIETGANVEALEGLELILKSLQKYVEKSSNFT